MIVDKSYQAVTGRKGEIINKAMGVDYSRYETGSIAFRYECRSSCPRSGCLLYKSPSPRDPHESRMPADGM